MLFTATMGFGKKGGRYMSLPSATDEDCHPQEEHL